MHRFNPNRLWTLIMVLGLSLGTACITVDRAFADGDVSIDGLDDDGVPVGMGDPDSPEGGGKTAPAPTVRPERPSQSFRLTFVGDESSEKAYLVWRLRFLLQTFGRTWIRF